MSIILEPSHALDSGDSLWILPLLPQSYWYKRLNWLTNFSLTSNELHSRPKMHPWLLKILETCDIEPPQIPLAEPLLVPTGQWLPTEWLVTAPITEGQEELFIQSLTKIWKQLQTPSLRLFLPPFINYETWEHLRTQYQLSKEISVVLEPSH